MNADTCKPGDLVAYIRNPTADFVEIGVVKGVRKDGAYVAYSTGDTCALTPWRRLKSVANGYAAPALAERMRQLGAEAWGLSEGCEDWSEAVPDV